MRARGRQQGYLLITVIVTLFLLSAIVMLLVYESASSARSANSGLEAARAEHVARAGMQNALWRAQQNACMGSFTIPATTLGADSYLATVTGASAGNLVVVDADKDAWIRSDDTGKNNGTAASNHVRFESGKIEQVLTHFDVSTIAANAQINSAIAWFHLKAGKSHPEGAITVHAVTADWEETAVTWDSFAGAFRPESIGAIPAQDTGDVWVALNLTGVVQSWVNGQPNNGILFNSEAEGLHTEYTAREDGTNPPRLEVVVGSGPASPAQIQVTGTLGSGVTRTLARAGVPVYDAASASTIALQPGSGGKDSFIDGASGGQTQNNGGSADLASNSQTSGLLRTLLQFDLASLPIGARVLSAELQLNLEQSLGAADTVQVHRITQSWSESGVTWISRDGGDDWSTPGGDYDPSPAGSFTADAIGFVTVDIHQLVQQWVNGTAENHGLMLLSQSASGDNRKTYVSSDDGADPSLHPKLTVRYACECGTPCMTPSGAGNVMLVIDNVFSPTIDDRAKRELFRAWGYDVNYYDDDTWQSLFDSGFGYHDVVFVAGSASATKLGDKLTNAPIGVVSEKGELNDNFGLASGYSNPVGEEISAVDTSHYITSIFSGGTLDIYEHPMQHLTASGTTSAGAQVLATVGAADALVVLDASAAMQGGGSTAGRRVMLPINEGIASWDYLTGDGLLLVQRSLAWAMNADAVSAGNLLMVVADDGSLTSQEITKKDLLESWGYAVSVIDDSDSQANFDAAVAANSVAYVPEDINSGALDTKLRDAAIGVVIEEEKITDEFGISTGETTFTESSIDIVDNTHYITEPFALGAIAFATSTQPVGGRAGTLASGLVVLGERPSSSTSMLDVIDIGGALAGTGTAAGRRAKLPWGGNDFDVNSLTDAGRTILRRSLEWAAGADSETDPGPIAHWKLDETSGTTAVDSEGGHDGVLLNGPTWTAGRIDGALDFDGSNDEIRVAHDPALSLTEAMTFTAWVNADAYGSSARQAILTKADASSHNYYFGVLGDEVLLEFEISGTFYTFTSTGSDLLPGTWYHIAATFENATDTIKLYVDGSEVLSDTFALDPVTNTSVIWFGSSVFYENWHGLLDDVRVYNRALSAAEIAELATAPLALPIAHWKLDETSGTTAADSVGGNDGTATNGPVWVPGIVDGALNFDGDNDYVDVGNMDVSGSGLTMTAWFNATTLSDDGRLISKATGTNASDAIWQLSLVSAGAQYRIRMRISASGATTTMADSSVDLEPGRWYLAAATYDNAGGQMKLYLDGVEVASGSHSAGGTLDTDSAVPVWIGANGTLARFFHGRIDDVRVYDRPLSAAEISDLFAMGNGGGGGSGGGAPELVFISTVADATFGGSNFGDDDIAQYDMAADSATVFFDGASFSSTDEDVNAVHLLADGRIVISTTGNATLGGLSFGDDDLIVYDPSSDSAQLLFDGGSVFGDSTEDIDAVYVVADGIYLMSTMTDATIEDFDVGDDDLFRFDANTGQATMFLDGGSVFSASDEDIDAVHRLADGRLLISTTGNATLGGLSFGDDDIVEYDPSTDTATLYFDGSAFSATDEDIDAVSR
ncbi:MAG: DNRLRE domain-containing protein [Woeseiaceae bacterium]|nr:DNRLRE domain-containing protein [Woeseiaceae bacterium]